MLEQLFKAYKPVGDGAIMTTPAGINSETPRTAQNASGARPETESVRVDVERLFMITQALWTILQELHGFTDEQLMQRIHEIDMLDGKLDGKVARANTPPDCPNCGKKLIGRHPLCLYCGTEVATTPFA